ncbi:MAG: glycosyl transferase family 1 [Flavobacteriales bacterium]|nr:glycosyl transferase family 1 [Flavobacteriales bacterium]|tara:strand:+ start:5274 stop:6401 length:1128 start_codon:yes stop_codon:yes gene_type:complete
MHVLLLTISYKSKFNPLSAPFFRDQALALKNNGFEVGVLCALPVSFKSIWKNKLFTFDEESYLDEGIHTLVSPFISIPKTPNRARRIRLEKGKELFRKYINENGRPDVIHVHSFLAGELAIWIKEEYNIPYVVTEHSTGFARDIYNTSFMELAKTVFHKSAVNIAVSVQFCQLLSKKFSLDFLFVPNVVDTSFFNLAVSDNTYDSYTFLNVAFLDKKKNHKGMIKSFAEHFKGKKAELLIAGDGPEANILKNYSRSLGVENQVELLGRKSRQEVRLLMQKADCFVLSSFHETFGVVLIEAMSCGTPVLSTKCGGPESIVTNDEVGILSDFDSFGENMALIYSKKYNPDTIRKYAVDHFSESVIAEKLIKIYNESV